MTRLQFRQAGAGKYAADVGDRVYHVSQVKGGWELSVWCKAFTDYVRPRTERTKAGCVAVARELESGRRARAAKGQRR